MLIDELRDIWKRKVTSTGPITMQEVVLTSDLGSKLIIKAENSIDDHFILQINDIGYHMPRDAANRLIKLLNKISKDNPDVEP